MAPQSRSWGFPRWRGYESGQEAAVKRMCDRDLCERPGDHKAPKSPEQLEEYYWFCQAHAEEYNRSWDYFANRSQEQKDEEIKKGRWHGRRTHWDTINNNEYDSGTRGAMAVLGLGAGDGIIELKRAYKEQVKEHHPDRGGDPEKFRIVTAAYTILLERLKYS